jgi:hypothetical protein
MDTKETAYIHVATAGEIEAKGWQPFGDIPGVTTKTLWHDPYGGSYAGVLKIATGAQIPAHSHRFASHHVWVVAGECEIGGRVLSEGSYAFVPMGVEHGIARVGEQRCTLFYLYLLGAEID